MDIKKLYDKYYTRLAREGMLKALFSGLTVGFVANAIVAFLCWYFDTSGLLWSLLALVVVTAATTPLFYLKKYKPTAKEVAQRLDRLGLKERMITMNELDGDDSYIAKLQREDAQVSLRSMDMKKIRFAFPRLMIIAVSIAFLFGGSMTTVSGLRDAGIISSGKDVIDQVLPEEPVVYITISYVVAEGEGVIETDDIQIIQVGENTVEVVAVADDGYVFVEWSDGVKDPVRMDYNLQEDTVFEATFAEIGDGEGEGEGDGDGEGEGQPGEGDKPSQSDKPSDPDAPPNNGANGAYEENNMVKDGNTPYRDIVDAYYEAAKEWLASAEGLPDDLKEFVETYFEVIV